MKKVITALINQNVNNKLKQYNDIEIVMNDIQYQEGIFEALEVELNIDYIILSELLPGSQTIKELIEKIQQKKASVRIVLILEKENKELENYLLSKGNIYIFYNNSIEIKKIAEIIQDNKEDLQKQIIELKQMIFDKKQMDINEIMKNDEIYDNKLINTKYKTDGIKENTCKGQNLKEEERQNIEQDIEVEYSSRLLINKIICKFNKIINKEKIKKQTKIIAITGIEGVGKSVFTVNIAKILEKQKKEVLIIDFDSDNNSIATLLGVKIKNEQNCIQNEYDSDFKNQNDLILKITSKIQLILPHNLKDNDNYNYNQDVNIIRIIKMLREIEGKYDFIIIDIGNKRYDKLNLLLKEAEKIIFITEANILQIKKTKNFLYKYINEYEIENEKIYILFNKIQDGSLGNHVRTNTFKGYKILGKLDVIKKCDLLINNKMKSIFLENKVKQQYKIIAKKLRNNIKTEQYYLEKIEE